MQKLKNRNNINYFIFYSTNVFIHIKNAHNVKLQIFTTGYDEI